MRLRGGLLIYKDIGACLLVQQRERVPLWHLLRSVCGMCHRESRREFLDTSIWLTEHIVCGSFS